MFQRTLKLAMIAAAVLLGLSFTSSPEASAQSYYRGGGHYHRAPAYYGGSSCNTYRSYRPSVSVGVGSYYSPSRYYGGYGYPSYGRSIYARPSYSGYYGGYGGYRGYRSPGYYGNRGGLSIGIRF